MAPAVPDLPGTTGVLGKCVPSGSSLRGPKDGRSGPHRTRPSTAARAEAKDQTSARYVPRAECIVLEQITAITLQGRQQSSAQLYPGPELASFDAYEASRCRYDVSAG